MLQDPTHPIWKIIRYAVTGIVITIMCATLYKNGFDPKDIILIIGTLSSLLGVDIVKSMTTQHN
jgi:hypothetical protein